MAKSGFTLKPASVQDTWNPDSDDSDENHCLCMIVSYIDKSCPQTKPLQSKITIVYAMFISQEIKCHTDQRSAELLKYK